MISQLFILSVRGDTLIMKDFRSDLTKNVPEKFFREVKTTDNQKPPIFEKDGITFAYLFRDSLYLACTTRFNMAPTLLIEMLSKAASVIQDLCGVLNEDAVRKNFVMIYEILDEMLDFGYPTLMSTKAVLFPLTPIRSSLTSTPKWSTPSSRPRRRRTGLSCTRTLLLRISPKLASRRSPTISMWT
jgi:hypothetical protein